MTTEIHPPKIDDERFVIERRIGAGAFGVVYAAFDRARGRRIALKVLQRFLPSDILRFKREFRALADVHHQNLVELHELLAWNEQLMFTMELVEGVDLFTAIRGVSARTRHAAEILPASALSIREVLEAEASRSSAVGTGDPTLVDQGNGRTDAREAAANDPRVRRRGVLPDHLPTVRDVFRQLGAGVAALHRAGLVHRDLKPGNVLVTDAGQVVILDFGLVAEVSRATPIDSLDGRIVGTPGYMPPEQIAGDKLGPASDWYAVGTMLFEALTGQTPFLGRGREVMRKKITELPPDLREIVPDVPEDLAALCSALLHTDPADRPSEGEVLRLLGVDEQPDALYGAPPTTFVGRDDTLRALDESYDRALTHGATLAQIEGEAGIGKTAVAVRFFDRLARGEGDRWSEKTGGRGKPPLIVQARCHEREAIPFKALDALLDSLVRQLHRATDRAPSRLPDDFADLERLFPVLAELWADSEATPQPPSSALAETQTDLRHASLVAAGVERRARAFEALRSLFASVAATGPLIVLLDDAQWCDSDSAEGLGAIVDACRSRPLLLVIATRDATAAALRPIAATLPGAARSYLTLGPLEHEAAAALALQLLGDLGVRAKPLAEIIARDAAGNPLFVHELGWRAARGATENPSDRAPSSARIAAANNASGPHGPVSVSRLASAAASRVSFDEVLGGRLDQLSSGALRLLDIIAVSGRSTPLGVLQRASGLGAEIHDAVSITRRQGLSATRTLDGSDPIDPRTVEAKLEVELVHDRVREVILARLSPAAITDLHAKLAIAYEATSFPDPIALVDHHLGAGDRERAAQYAETAGERAMTALAFARATSLFSLALDQILDRPSPTDGDPARTRSIRIRLAEALAASGHAVEAARQFSKAAEDLPASESLPLRRRAAENLLRGGMLDEGLQAAEAILEELDVRRSPASIALRKLMVRMRIGAFRPQRAATIDPMQIHRIDTLWAMALSLGSVDGARGRELQDLHLLLAEESHEPLRTGRARVLQAAYESVEGERSIPRVNALLSSAREVAAMIPTDEGQAHAAYGRAMGEAAGALAALCQGKWRAATSLGDRASARMVRECAEASFEIGVAQVTALHGLMSMGDAREIARRLPRLARDARSRGDLYSATRLRTEIEPFLRMARAPRNASFLAAPSPFDDVQVGWLATDGRPTLQHGWLLMHRAQAMLIAGLHRRAWTLMEETWPTMTEAPLRRTQFMHVLAASLRARIALQMRAERGFESRAIEVASEAARTIEEEQTTWGLPLATLVRALLAGVGDGARDTVEAMRTAERALRSVDMTLHAAAVRARRGEAIGGARGRAMRTSALNEITALGIDDPRAWAATLVP